MLAQIETLLNILLGSVVTFLTIMLGFRIWHIIHGNTIKAQFYCLFSSLAYIAIAIIQIGFLIVFILNGNDKLQCFFAFVYALIFAYFSFVDMDTFKHKRT